MSLPDEVRRELDRPPSELRRRLDRAAGETRPQLDRAPVLAAGPTRRFSGVRSLASRARSFLRLAWWKFDADEASLRAQGLTYTTILSLVPFLAVAFSVLTAFGVQNQLEPMLRSAFAPLGEEASEVSRRIVEFVSHMEVGVLGALGLAGLFYTVVSLIGTIESSLNTIWRIRESRSWPDKFRDYLSVVIVGPVLVFTALALTASAQSHVLVQRALALVPSAIIVAVAVVLPYLLLSLAFTLLYRLMPNTRVSLRAAAAGGVFAGVGWKLAGTAFTAFVASSGSYAAIYSGFAILILFILWVYVSWSIALAGGIIAYLVDHFATEVHRAEDEWLGERERDALRLVAIVAERHAIDAPPIELAELSRRLDRSLDVVDEMVAQLVDRRILVITATPPGIALARIPERVSVAEVLGAVSRMPRDGVASGSRAIVEVLQRRYEAGLRAVERVHVSDLLAAPGPLGAASPEVVGDPEPRSVGEAGAQRV